MKKFLQKWKLYIINGLILIAIIIIGIMYGKKNNNNDRSVYDDLDAERRSHEGRTDSGFDRIESTIGRIEDHNNTVTDRGESLHRASEELSNSSDRLSDLSTGISEFVDRLEGQLSRNKDILQRLQNSGK